MKKINQYFKYYIGCEVKEDYSGKKKGILLWVDIIGYKVGVQHNSFWRFNLDEIKPILSRLQDMTEEDKAEILEIDDQAWFKLNEGDFNFAYILLPVFHFLISKGYWLFGDEAFDQGLIVDKKTFK